MAGAAALTSTDSSGSARYVILVLASLQLLMSSGLVLGWMGFLLIFRGEGTFTAKCSAEEHLSGACARDEDLALATIYTVGLTVAAMAPLPLGLIIDRCESPRLVGVAFAAGTALGFFVLAISNSKGFIAVGFALFSFFGSGIQLNLFHVASLFPDGKGLVMGWFTTLFGFSALLPMGLFYIWEWLDSPADARRTLFLWFSAMLCCFVAFSATIGAKFGDGDRVRWGCRGFELVATEHIAVEPAAGCISQDDNKDDALEGADGPFGSETDTNCGKEACSLEYKAFLVFFTLHFFRSLFYLGAVDLQVASIARSTVAAEREKYVTINGWIKPFGTLVGPPIGHIIHQRPDDGAAIVATLVVATSALHGAAAVAGVFWLLPIAFAGAALAEESVITFMFSYIEHRFGFEHFGTLTGLVLFINGLVAMLVYPLLGAIVTSWTTADVLEVPVSLHANATNEIEENRSVVVPFWVWRQLSAVFLGATMLSVAYPAWLYRRAKHLKKKRASTCDIAQEDASRAP